MILELGLNGYQLAEFYQAIFLFYLSLLCYSVLYLIFFFEKSILFLFAHGKSEWVGVSYH